MIYWTEAIGEAVQRPTMRFVPLKTMEQHGYAIAQRIHQATDDSLRIEEGSLYPALQRMTGDKWLRAHWGTTQTGRKARFYTITPAGRRQLEEEERRWVLLTEAVNRALRFA